MNTNEYEIRMEVLSLAHRDCWTKFHENLNVLRVQDQHTMDNYYRNKDNDASTPWPKLSLNTSAIESHIPSPADIKARAKELYSFVERG